MVLKLSDPLLHLRAITANDEEVLCQIYSSTRTAELAQLTNWTSHQKEIFLRSQFTAQHTYYQHNYKGAHFWVVEYGAEVIGRLYLHTHFEGATVRIIDISLLPEWRNRGIGKQILLAAIDLAVSLHRPLTIHVESFNPAMHLYTKLGFKLLSETNGVYHMLEWKKNTRPLKKNLSLKQPVECL